MKTICFIMDSMGSGGAERVVSNLANQLIMYKYKVYIICISVNEIYSFYYLDDNVILQTLTMEDKKVPKYLRRVKIFRKKLELINPDVLISLFPHTHVYTYLANKSLKIKHIVSERNNPYTSPKNFLLRLFRKHIFNQADGCVFQTKEAMEFFGEKVLNKSIKIPNPIVIDNSITLKKRNPMNYIVSVGRLVKQKNYPMLLNAFKDFLQEYPYYKLKIYGEGILKQELIDLANSLGIIDSIEFKGAVINLHEEIFNAKMFVMTSNYEGMPNALIEAMALGLPCICTDCPIGGPRELIKNYHNGILISIGDSIKLANVMKQIVDDDKLANMLSKNSIKIADELNIKVITKMWIDFIFNN